MKPLPFETLIKKISEAKNLTKCTIKGKSFSHEQQQQLFAALAANETITVLQFENCSFKSPEINDLFNDLIANNNTLTTLALKGNTIPALLVVDILRALKNNDLITHFLIEDIPLDFESMLRMCHILSEFSAEESSLKTLSLIKTDLNDAAALQLSVRLEEFKTLESLILEKNNITIKGLNYLLHIFKQGRTSLLHISLCDNPLPEHVPHEITLACVNPSADTLCTALNLEKNKDYIAIKIRDAIDAYIEHYEQENSSRPTRISVRDEVNDLVCGTSSSETVLFKVKPQGPRGQERAKKLKDSLVMQTSAFEIWNLLYDFFKHEGGNWGEYSLKTKLLNAITQEIKVNQKTVAMDEESALTLIDSIRKNFADNPDIDLTNYEYNGQVKRPFFGWW